MRTKIIIVAILIATLFVSGCIDNGIENLNKEVLNLSQSIENGDNSYNKAVNHVNNRDFDSANVEIGKALENFTDAQNKTLHIIEKYSNIKEQTYKKYFKIINSELNLKYNASNNIQTAISYYSSGHNKTGNKYLKKANEYMDKGVASQNKRKNLVNNNSAKFKG
ncbi:hypothetical protein [Methanobrevibacter filiformis]|uniref:Lipoprotein n=1 Tax=Methanobrevibacter filiformis TaxID=55758 RepID=A0A166BLG4_9EURY|nr:hypothetical protein [Methanobrevibacter filiformis]KZX13524.1 hypothetical protein MBFIL_10460 [Methanobrevibacter filiformis]